MITNLKQKNIIMRSLTKSIIVLDTKSYNIIYLLAENTARIPSPLTTLTVFGLLLVFSKGVPIKEESLIVPLRATLNFSSVLARVPVMNDPSERMTLTS